MGTGSNPESPAPKDPRLEQLRRVFADARTSGARILSISLPVLIIGAALVEQELREQHLRVGELAGRIDRAIRAQARSAQEVRVSEGRGRDAVNRARMADAIARSIQEDSLPDVARAKSSWKALNDYEQAILKRWDEVASVERQGDASNSALPAAFQLLEVECTCDSLRLTKGEVQTEEQSIEPAPAIDTRRRSNRAIAFIETDEYRGDSVQRRVRKLDDQVRLRNDATSDADHEWSKRMVARARRDSLVKLATNQTETLRSLLRQRQRSIPTPFGSFAIDPRIALWGVLLIALLLHQQLIRLSRNAVTAARQSTGMATGGIADDSAPFWIYSADRRADQALGWDARGAAQAAISAWGLHLFWLALSALLLIDGIRWRTSSLVLPPFGAFVDVIATVLLLVSLVLAARHLLSGHASDTDAELTEDALLNRRTFLGAALVVIASLSGASWRGLLRRVRPSARSVKVTINVSELPGHAFIRNSRTGVVHFEPLCRDHLGAIRDKEPLERWSAQFEPICPAPKVFHGVRLHAGSAATVLEGMALAALRCDRTADAIRYLEQARAIAPSNVRIYDQLVRLHRRARNFDQVWRLHRQGLSHALAVAHLEGPQLVAAFRTRITGSRHRKENGERRRAETLSRR